MGVTTPRCCTIAQVLGWQWPVEIQCFDDEHIINDGSLLDLVPQVARHQPHLLFACRSLGLRHPYGVLFEEEIRMERRDDTYDQ